VSGAIQQEIAPMPEMEPRDEHNARLLGNVHPSDWQNPTPDGRYNLVVIGAGTAGLVCAAGAAGLGAKVALIERHLLGGDCLNTGCVPSKAIIRSSRAVADIHNARSVGIAADGAVAVDFPAVMERMRRLRADISTDDAAARFRDLGVDVYLGDARFAGRDVVQVDGQTLRFSKAAIATGARAAVPDIPGIEACGYLTNETVFSLTELPARLAVIGGGPIGCELAQAFARLGCDVTLLHRGGTLLAREDGFASKIVDRALRRSRVSVELGADPTRVQATGAARTLSFRAGDGEQAIDVDQILVATGRAPNVEGIDLDIAGVEYDTRRGVRVDDRLRTTNPAIYAAGDVCMSEKFTHAADAAARIVIQNALFRGRKRLSDLLIPRCIYTDPEVATVGLTAAQATESGVAIDTYQRAFTDVHRAVVDGETEGVAAAHVRRGSDRIVGATIVARNAGDMIGEVTVAMTNGVGLGKLAGVIHPYPTQAEAIKHIADMYSRTRLTPTLSKWFTRWMAWTR
jgi:pyruvate/2-oxoglutarate dehydrogenase complex dihydrolipoamide dehydrogenase (E3) component